MQITRILAMVMKTVPLIASFIGNAEAQKSIPWVAYYADTASPEAFFPYQLVVFDSDRHPSLPALRSPERKILGYLSVGEVNETRAYFSETKEEKILLKENENWKGSYMVDIRDPRWTRRILEELVPFILQQGFDGVFLDTLDNPPYLEQTNPANFKGMKAAAVSLVKRIREEFPGIQIMMNRGYDILEDVAPALDMVLGESVYATYNGAAGKYELTAESNYRTQVNILKKAVSVNSKLDVFTLDYWDPADRAGREAIYKKERENGFHPYVSTPLLNEVIPE